MTSSLITTWAEYDDALQKILLLASASLHIVDEDLLKLKLDDRNNADCLRRFLAANRKSSLRIALRNAEPFRRNSPRLMTLLATFPQQMSVIECPRHLAPASDSLCLADERSALVRFNTDHARGRIIIDDRQQCTPYENEFSAILGTGGEQVSATTLGL